MSLYGMMRTGGSGMNAQANRLGTVAENIANASTTGYKRSSTEFSSLILPTTGGSYNSGGVETKVRRSISDDGATTITTSASDLAINGKGFFVVADQAGADYMTRAGAFTQDKSGTLVNSAGFKLQGYTYDAGQDPTVVVNGFQGLVDINLASGGLVAKGTTTGAMGANLNSGAATGDISKTSLSVFDSQGNTRLLDITYKKLSENEWEVNVSDKATGLALLSPAASLSFNKDGTLATASPSVTLDGSVLNTSANGTIPGTGATLADIELDFGKTTQVGYTFTPAGAVSNGNAPSKVAGFEIDDDGIVYVKYENNKLDPRYRLAMATVQSPDNLVPQAGNVYTPGADSGTVAIGFPGTGQFGRIKSNALEGSNVDIADELTSMIESQRSYTANSKVFQTGADLLDVLVNLKR